MGLFVFSANSDHFGASAIAKINGLAQLSGKNSFLFPVGDFSRLQPLKIDSDIDQVNMICSYTFNNPFSNRPLDDNLETISTVEHWFLSSTIPTQITIGWDGESNLDDLMDDFSKLTLVGFHILKQEWESIPLEAITGTLQEGFMTSQNFIPDDYAALTFGAMDESGSVLSDSFIFDLGNYYLSPNNDGINDRLEFPELSEFPENKLSIYDRNGLKVFEQLNYTNEFAGIGNTDGIYFDRLSGLPEGVYFYIVNISSNNQEFQGYIYLKR